MRRHPLFLAVALAAPSAAACGPGGSEAGGSAPDTVAGPPAADTAAPALRVAVTIDDVPRSGRGWAGIDWEAETRRLLAQLTDRGVPAVAYVTCANRPPAGSLLPLWREAGTEPGNHTYRHRDLNTEPLDVWLSDVRRCHDEIARDWGRPPATFRYPMLHRGPTEERKSAAAVLLDSLGTPDGPVTIDNSEWVIAAAYADAPPDSDRDARFRELYVEHMLRMLEHYRTAARDGLGRDPAHVLLLHANALNARHMGVVLDAYRERGVEFVPLAEALEDPFYGMEDRYVGRRGLSWIYRTLSEAPEEAERFDREEEDRLREVLDTLAGG